MPTYTGRITHVNLTDGKVLKKNLMSLNCYAMTQCSVCALQQVEVDAKQHSIETTTASIVQLVVQLTCILEVAGSNTVLNRFFFFFFEN